MSADQNGDLPPLEPGLAQALAAKVSDAIRAAAQNSPGRPASLQTRKLVAKRVPPSWLPKYNVMDEYGFVIWDETMTILDRILVYPFAASYRKHLVGAPKEVIGAWQFHSHSLRVGELYIVQDRTVALLDFLKAVATDCGLPVTDQRKSFESHFKKSFERRLRERHRLTHAHERPSAVSRIIDLSGAKWTNDEDEALEVTELFAEILPRLIEASKAAGRSPPESPEDVQALYESAALQEARQMLKLVGEALLGTINEPTVAIDS